MISNIDNKEINEELTHMKDYLRWTESISNDCLVNIIEDQDKK